jgi:hypothetical protein
MEETLNYVGTLLAGIAAILGIRWKTRDDATGRLTRTGKVLIALAILGLATSTVILINKVRSNWQKKENERLEAERQVRRHQEVLFGYKQFRDMTVSCSFDPSVTEDSFRKEPIALKVYFERPHFNLDPHQELKIYATLPENVEMLPSGSLSSLLKQSHLMLTENQGAYVRPPVFSVHFLENNRTYQPYGPTLEIQFNKQNVIWALQNKETVYKGWPYETLGDFDGVQLHVEVNGSLKTKITGTKIFINDNYVLEIPRESLDGRVAIDNVFRALVSKLTEEELSNPSY